MSTINLATADVKLIAHKPDRAVASFSLASVFGLKLKKDIQIQGFAAPGILTPEINPNYKFPVEETVTFLMALQLKDNIYLKGHSGTGKTELARQIAARLNYNVVQVNFDGHLLRSDLVGDVRMSAGSTYFRYGLVPYAFMEPGTMLLLDEVDAVAPETAFVLQRAVSEDRSFFLNETSELIKLHNQNVIVATANTNGMGDDSGLYLGGTNVQNFSFLNRWGTTINVDYIPPAQEKEILSGMFSDLPDTTIDSIVKVMDAARKAFKAGSVSIPLTTRDSINWARKLRVSKLPMRTAKYSFLNRMPIQDAMQIAQLIQRSFTLDAGDDRTYLGTANTKAKF